MARFGRRRQACRNDSSDAELMRSHPSCIYATGRLGGAGAPTGHRYVRGHTVDSPEPVGRSEGGACFEGTINGRPPQSLKRVRMTREIAFKSRAGL
jgi:hypothetical protein